MKIIEATNLSLAYCAARNRHRSLKEFVLGALTGDNAKTTFHAVDNVSFSINRGEIVGLIGRNGAGKTTLLRVIAGILTPTGGTVKTHGAVYPLLAIGSSMAQELTGRENIFLNGAILGYSKNFLKANEQKIIDFAEIGRFIDNPVRTYSSGMAMRLAFSIATIATPEILILDEVLAVGDTEFREKCYKRINEMISGDTTVLFVSHSLQQITNLCTRAIWLESGHIRADGPAAEICDAYTNSMKM